LVHIEDLFSIAGTGVHADSGKESSTFFGDKLLDNGEESIIFFGIKMLNKTMHAHMLL
jgi:hypothetical protein